MLVIPDMFQLGVLTAFVVFCRAQLPRGCPDPSKWVNREWVGQFPTSAGPGSALPVGTSYLW